MAKEMKESGIDWIGEIPAHWKITTIKNIFKVVSGGTPSTNNPAFWADGLVPWATPKDFSNAKNEMLFDTDRKITNSGVQSCSAEFIPEDSIILSTRAPVGNVVVNKVKLTTNQGCKSLVNKNNLTDYKFYFYAMKISKNILESISTGTTFLELSGEKLKNFNIMLPPVQEQQLIAHFLDQKTAHIDSIIDDTKKSIEELKKYKIAMIAEAVTKGLNANSEMKSSGVQWIGEIPNHWEIKRIGNLFINRTEKVSDYDFEALSVTKNGVFPQLDNVAKSDNHNDRKKVCKGDFVINSRSDRKMSSGVSSMDGSVSLINIVLYSDKILPEYTKYLLKNYGFAEEFYRWGTGIVADLWSTNFEKMKRISIPQPPKEEQLLIATFLDQKTAHIDNLIEQKQQLITEFENYKKSLIYEYVTGKQEVM